MSEKKTVSSFRRLAILTSCFPAKIDLVYLGRKVFRELVRELL